MKIRLLILSYHSNQITHIVISFKSDYSYCHIIQIRLLILSYHSNQITHIVISFKSDYSYCHIIQIRLLILSYHSNQITHIVISFKSDYSYCHIIQSPCVETYLKARPMKGLLFSVGETLFRFTKHYISPLLNRILKTLS